MYTYTYHVDLYVYGKYSKDVFYFHEHVFSIYKKTYFPYTRIFHKDVLSIYTYCPYTYSSLSYLQYGKYVYMENTSFIYMENTSFIYMENASCKYIHVFSMYIWVSFVSPGSVSNMYRFAKETHNFNIRGVPNEGHRLSRF